MATMPVRTPIWRWALQCTAIPNTLMVDFCKRLHCDRILQLDCSNLRKRGLFVSPLSHLQDSGNRRGGGAQLSAICRRGRRHHNSAQSFVASAIQEHRIERAMPCSQSRSTWVLMAVRTSLRMVWSSRRPAQPVRRFFDRVRSWWAMLRLLQLPLQGRSS